jgi:hypothetical protein
MAQHRNWFSKRTGRKESPIPEASMAIDAHDVQISRETMMLEPIVQYDDLRIECRDRVMSDDPPITADQHGNTRRVGRENEGFVS